MVMEQNRFLFFSMYIYISLLFHSMNMIYKSLLFCCEQKGVGFLTHTIPIRLYGSFLQGLSIDIHELSFQQQQTYILHLTSYNMNWPINGKLLPPFFFRKRNLFFFEEPWSWEQVLAHNLGGQPFIHPRSGLSSPYRYKPFPNGWFIMCVPTIDNMYQLFIPSFSWSNTDVLRGVSRMSDVSI